MTSATKACLFDSNGTLLDTGALDPHFEDIFGNALYRQLWFKTVLHTSLVLNQTARYQEFTKIGDEVLESMAQAEGRSLGIGQKLSFKKTLLTLPLFPDVLPGLQKLQDEGYRLFVLTNSGKPTALAQMLHAGISGRFEQILSTDGAEAFKPAAAAYGYALDQLGLQASECWMVAGHAWDIAGAARAGMKTALLLRKDHGLNGCFAEPDVRAPSLVELAERIAASDR